MGCQRSVDLPVRLPLGVAGAEALAGQVAALLHEGSTHQVVCVTDGVPDLADVDALARLHLVARRGGVRLVVRAPDGCLTALLQLTGLADVLDAER